MGGVSGPIDPPRDGEGDRGAERRGGGGASHSLRRPEVYEARKARREMSLPEVLLWQRLKGSPQGIAFRKQHPIGPYRADFYCAATKLIIEVDGIGHDLGDRPEHDVYRTEKLERQGFSVVRVLASDVLHDPDAVADSLVVLASSPPPPPLRGGPPPRERGGS
ncbi:DUF559 domain-containing protein [Sphingomonas sp. MAH-20]|uniref:DUF559 domain-containing protein n=1 Tax=Sphingomonas horti TaxID=2682842 RepID=A0A6I4IZ26_9SPHN|nr:MULTISPECIES: DUF559 domain-containing protein [Sphingomonas]MBA2918174.1 endonuclease domain-containing protein [Sphingomonas sp. CGMCC 1.13658]MVO77143.1 DUF559 domain-containing protein [Sphingomonas horti]